MELRSSGVAGVAGVQELQEFRSCRSSGVRRKAGNRPSPQKDGRREYRLE
ncbi:MAG: hypothetical protein JO207_03815, partial [Verrucomicrobia bacterium]|nr:hypothetical protein [Verrucomicrobiota bacterium]